MLKITKNTPIDALDPTVRTWNTLVRHGIKTVGDLEAVSISEIRDWPHMGQKMYAEILAMRAQRKMPLIEKLRLWFREFYWKHILSRR